MSYFKSVPVRSKALRNAARGADCTVRFPGCNGGGDTTVLAHLPHAGRGMARKASDVDAIFCCSACHDQLDGRAPRQANVSEFWPSLLRAHSETMQRWIDAGLVEVAS